MYRVVAAVIVGVLVSVISWSRWACAYFDSHDTSAMPLCYAPLSSSYETRAVLIPLGVGGGVLISSLAVCIALRVRRTERRLFAPWGMGLLIVLHGIALFVLVVSLVSIDITWFAD